MSDATTRPSYRRAPQRPLVTAAVGLALMVVAALAVRSGIVIPAAWAALGLAWLVVRFVMFETATRAVVPVSRWRSDGDLQSPSLDISPADHIAWPVLALPAPDGGTREVHAPFGYYLHEFTRKDDPDVALPDILSVRYHASPVGSLVMADDRAYVLTGPALFIAAMLVLWSLWAPLAQVVVAARM